MNGGVTNEVLEGYLELRSSGLVATSCQARAILPCKQPHSLTFFCRIA